MYRQIPEGQVGPLFAKHNHSPAIAECPNGDLLAIWYSCVTEPGPELCNAASRLRFGAKDWEAPSPFWDGPDVNDPTGVDGNLALNPLFVAFSDDGDPGNDDFHLQPGSPCIDAGYPDKIVNDVDGTRNDMGAYGGPLGDW